MRNDSVDLHLHEAILLLALRDKEGTFRGKSYLPALAGALLAELLLARRITIEEGSKKLVTPVESRSMNEPLLDEILEKIRTAKRRASLRTWVQRISGLSKLQHRVAAGLCRRGILREDEDQVLIFFRRKIYPEVDPRPERHLIDRLRRAIFSGDRDLDSWIVVLISLASSADLLSIPFEKWRLKERKDRIKAIVSGQLIGQATKETIEAAQAAVMVASIVPSVMASTRAGR